MKENICSNNIAMMLLKAVPFYALLCFYLCHAGRDDSDDMYDLRRDGDESYDVNDDRSYDDYERRNRNRRRDYERDEEKDLLDRLDGKYDGNLWDAENAERENHMDDDFRNMHRDRYRDDDIIP